jgi:two-component system, sensor histidine kinase
MTPENTEAGCSSEARVLVVTSSHFDAIQAAESLRAGGIPVDVVEVGATLGVRLTGGVSTVVIAEESLTDEAAVSLLNAIAAQPEWSDLPVVIVTSPGTNRLATTGAIRDLLRVGNVVLLERPLSNATFLSTIRMALRARARQRKLGSLLTEHAEQDPRPSKNIAAMGKLAASLGHDLDNVLLPLRMRLEILADRTDLPAEARQDIVALAGLAERLVRLRQSLRDVAHDPLDG